MAQGMIEVFITQGVDKKTIIDMLPQYKGYLKFTIGSKVPAHAIDVTPKQFVAPPKNAGPGIGNVPNASAGGELEPGGGLKKNPPGLTLERGPGGIPTGYAQLPEVPPGVGAPQAVGQ
jgi:hypothetical protein